MILDKFKLLYSTKFPWIHLVSMEILTSFQGNSSYSYGNPSCVHRNPSCFHRNPNLFPWIQLVFLEILTSFHGTHLVPMEIHLVFM